jgi:hypothetical protein
MSEMSERVGVSAGLKVLCLPAWQRGKNSGRRGCWFSCLIVFEGIARVSAVHELHFVS